MFVIYFRTEYHRPRYAYDYFRAEFYSPTYLRTKFNRSTYIYVLQPCQFSQAKVCLRSTFAPNFTGPDIFVVYFRTKYHWPMYICVIY